MRPWCKLPVANTIPTRAPQPDQRFRGSKGLRSKSYYKYREHENLASSYYCWFSFMRSYRNRTEERPWQDQREKSNGRGYKKRSATQGKVDPPFDWKSGDKSESGDMWGFGILYVGIRTLFILFYIFIYNSDSAKRRVFSTYYLERRRISVPWALRASGD